MPSKQATFSSTECRALSGVTEWVNKISVCTHSSPSMLGLEYGSHRPNERFGPKATACSEKRTQYRQRAAADSGQHYQCERQRMKGSVNASRIDVRQPILRLAYTCPVLLCCCGLRRIEGRTANLASQMLAVIDTPVHTVNTVLGRGGWRSSGDSSYFITSNFLLHRITSY